MNIRQPTKPHTPTDLYSTCIKEGRKKGIFLHERVKKFKITYDLFRENGEPVGEDVSLKEAEVIIEKYEG